jgi:enoyl-CoA hydratase/carnithine racemase
MTAPVLAESADGIALLTFNRPEWLNAINVEMAEAFADAIETAHRDPSVRVILLSGEGCAFVAGRGLASFQSAERLAAAAPGHGQDQDAYARRFHGHRRRAPRRRTERLCQVRCHRGLHRGTGCLLRQAQPRFTGR